MKHILVELDDWCARDLERTTARAYLAQPLAAELAPADLVGWDDHNDLARPARVPKRPL